jgi:hypothetical protein
MGSGWMRLDGDVRHRRVGARCARDLNVGDRDGRRAGREIG